MQDEAVSLEMLEAYLARKHKRLAFPPELEALYDLRMQSFHRKIMARNVWPTILVYNGFLIADLLLVPQTAFIASMLHLGIVTPVILLVAFLCAKIHRKWLREVLRSFVPFLMVAQIMYIYARNTGVGADQYQNLAVMTVIYMNINLRFGFGLAVASTAVIMATYLSVLLTGPAAMEVKFTGAAMMAAAAYLTLMANRRMEQDVRFGFLRRLQDQLRREAAEKQSKQDALTGLANRRMLSETVDHLWSDGAAQHALAAVVMIDVDHFKAYNDRYGHAAGDECLVRIANLIGRQYEIPKNASFRYGGEEFLLLLPRAGMIEAIRLAEHIRVEIERLALPHQDHGPLGVVTASFGVAGGPVSAHSFSELLSAADAALYAAKRNGRNQVWPPFISQRDVPTEPTEQSGTA